MPLIENFSPINLRAWCEGLGQETFIGSTGRVFPKSMKASPLLRAWLGRLEELGVEYRLRHQWQGWDETGDLLFNTPSGTERIKSAAALLALGGASWPGLGSDGGWTDILKRMNILVNPLLPANCGFNVNWSDFFCEKFAGHPLKNIRLECEGRTVPGEITITKSGAEGGAIYMLSSRIRDFILDNGAATITIDLRPALSADQIMAKLSIPRGRQSFSTWIQKALGLTPAATGLLREVDRDIQNRDVSALAALVKAAPLTLTSPFAIYRAISTAGGIVLDELDEKLMLKKIPGLFAAGEMLDWEAPTGGYLLQACFSTGRAAGSGILKYLDESAQRDR